MNAKELRSKTIPELQQHILDVGKEIENESDSLVKGKSKNTRKIVLLRRDIARVLTIIKEKEETRE